MFSEVELLRDVGVLAKDRKIPVSQRSIMSRLLKNLLIEKVSKDYGYFIAVTSLKSIGKGETADSCNIFFPVVFNCRIYMPLRGEILEVEGVVQNVERLGVYLRCGPLKYVFLAAQKMPNYHYVPGISPHFMNNELSRIENGAAICFEVLAVKWYETSWDVKRDFVILAEGAKLMSGVV